MLTAVNSEPFDWDGKHIQFRLIEYDERSKRKTVVCAVTAKKDGSLLGEVRWFAKWRKYAFLPAPDCLFEETCLGDIAEYLKWATYSEKHGL